MTQKIKKRWIFLFILILLILVSISIHVIIGQGKKEILAAKEFKKLLESNNIVEEYKKSDTLTYDSIKIIDSSNSSEYYTVSTKVFTVNVDSSYKVIGFNNLLKSNYNNQQIGEEEAKCISEEYLKKIYDGQYKFEEIKEDNVVNIPYYTFIFKKYEEGYPYYDKKISMQINKYTGKLEGYVNLGSDLDLGNLDILITEEEAYKKALLNFSEVNKNGEKAEGTFKALSENEDATLMELCYIVTIKGIDEEDKEVKFKYFISVNDGRIIKVVRDNINKTTT